MSTAMAITHQRNNHAEMAQKSEQVTERSVNLIRELQLNATTNKLKKLQDTINLGEGEYQQFLQRWGYDEEQKQTIKKIAGQLLNNDGPQS